jgi:hypothetical protein
MVKIYATKLLKNYLLKYNLYYIDFKTIVVNNFILNFLIIIKS